MKGEGRIARMRECAQQYHFRNADERKTKNHRKSKQCNSCECNEKIVLENKPNTRRKQIHTKKFNSKCKKCAIFHKLDPQNYRPADSSPRDSTHLCVSIAMRAPVPAGSTTNHWSECSRRCHDTEDEDEDEEDGDDDDAKQSLSSFRRRPRWPTTVNMGCGGTTSAEAEWDVDDDDEEDADEEDADATVAEEEEDDDDDDCI